MASHGFVTQGDKLEFRQIILGFIKRIIELTLRVVPKEYKLEFTEAYADSIRSLSDVLLPHYDAEMYEAYATYQKSFSNLEDPKNKTPQSIKVEFLRRTHRELFRELNKLMGRKDYLKAALYSEGDEDDIGVVDIT